MSYLIIIGLAIYGLILGSFINALVWRLEKKLDADGNPLKLSSKDKNKLSVIKGHSMCPNCKHKLVAKDLVPVLSWLSLRGKCRYCNKPISKQYPTIETATAVLFVLSYIFWPYDLLAVADWILFIGYLLTMVCLIAMAIYDYKTKILPSVLTYSGILIYLLTLILHEIFGGQNILINAITSAILFFLIFFTIFYVSYYATKRGLSAQEWLGFGDVQLAVLLGLLIGQPILIFLSMFTASVAGIIYAVLVNGQKRIKLNSQIPFGPFLIFGAIVTFWWGDSLLNWYSSSLLGL